MKNSFNTKKTLQTNSGEYEYFSIKEAEKTVGKEIAKLPFSLKVLLENMLRNEDGVTVSKGDITAFVDWVKNGGKVNNEIAYRPARVLMQDFTGVPAVVDLAAMRDGVKNLGGDPQKINPQVPVDLVIDHSVMVDKYATDEAFGANVKLEMERNAERYKFLKWGQSAFENFKVVPPGTGICHQVNLEYLAKVVWSKELEDGTKIAYPDTLVGTDSHTTMINGLAVLGWGVGGIEAEAAMLGQPISMLIPEVVGLKLEGKLKEGVTATDLVLTATEILRNHGVVGKFVEFYGDGLNNLSLADRATIANMAPEYGATCGFFPVDGEVLKYLNTSAREEETIELTEKYAKAQGMWREEGMDEPVYSAKLNLNMQDVVPSIAGPKRPQDKISLKDAASEFKKAFLNELKDKGIVEKDEYLPSPGEDFIPDEVKNANTIPHDTSDAKLSEKVKIHARGEDFSLQNGDIVIAAITSCTNTSNPSVMIGAGLVAKKALELGLKVKPWVKTSLAPGSKVVTEYLEKAGLQDHLDALGFNLVGYGCTTCIGNSGPINPQIEQAIIDNDLVVASVLSGNRNFEGRVHALTKGNYLMSPPLVVAYAIAGNATIDITTEALGKDKNGKDVFLKDIWPTDKEVQETLNRTVTRKMFSEKYADVFKGTEEWQKIEISGGETYEWDDSTYINNPPYFEGMTSEVGGFSDVKNASILALLGDSITTDHISPAGVISKGSPAANYLTEKGVDKANFNSYGSRRGNHEVMMRGTFANVRIKNEMAEGTEGGVTTYIPTGDVTSIYDAAMMYKHSGVPLVVIGGKDYGMGSSRDWAAKGTNLLGVKAVIAESYERIHRSNLVGMGVLPLTFKEGETRKTLKLKGDEKISISGVAAGITPKMDVGIKIEYADGQIKETKALCRIDTINEVEYYQNGGILHKVIRDLAS